MTKCRFASFLIQSICLFAFLCNLGAEVNAQEPSNGILAGAAAIDISPTKLPVRVAGGFLEGNSDQLRDSLYARAIVIQSGSTKIAMVVVDTCMMAQSLIESAKQQASNLTSIPTDQMMVSATHTHSAPAAMACLGTRQDNEYAAELPSKIAECIVAANKNLQPARIGWSSIDDWEHTHNRRWIRKPENKVVDPFGNPTGLAHMHPGYLSPSIIGPSGPVDPTLSVVSIQSRAGRPLAVLANYSQHYFGTSALSADYYGLFCKHVATLLGEPGNGNGPFVAAISQGTSGDLMWMDYGSAAESISMDNYAEAVARYAELALAKIEYHDSVPIAIVEKDITLNYRVPDEQRLKWATPIAAKIEDELPKNIPEVYAMEALILHERQKTNLKLQAIRIGDLTIATLPNEVYALTGMKLRGRTPATAHFNIELANGAEGYIPPPEQHALGGYTTWPARTAGLEVQAEPKIVESLVDALEQVTGKPRRTMQDEHGQYATSVLQAKPISYWRLNDEDGNSVRNAVQGGQAAQLSPGYALYLPGVASGTGIGEKEHLISSDFSGSNQINRAVHLAGGELSAESTGLNNTYSFAFWFWLGEHTGASSRRGKLCVGPAGESIVAVQSADHFVQLEFVSSISPGKWRADDWNFAVVIRHSQDFKVFVNGESEPAIQATISSSPINPQARLRFGVGMQGKLDEVAVFDRALNTVEIEGFWKASGIGEQRNLEEAERLRVSTKSTASAKPPIFPTDYIQTMATLKPIMASPLTETPKSLEVSGKIAFDTTTFATLNSARIASRAPEIAESYSVSLWFRNDLASNVRPVTAYLFSRGPDGDAQAPGDHLGIGGTYQTSLTGKLIFFNGNASNKVVTGRTVLAQYSWNHVVLIRDGAHVKVFLNNATEPEIDADVEMTASQSKEAFFGARNDYFAPLQGSLAHIVLFNRVLNSEETVLLNSAAKQNPSNRVAIVKPIGAHELIAPDSLPVSIEESLTKIHVPRGYRVELVAAEPDVVDPVAFDWDESGRLWVVEMSDYPLGMDGRGKAGGRVRVLEDCDHDGRFEKSRLFADGLSFPNGILTWRDGVLVTAAPEIIFMRDTDGDGEADQREVLFSGFNEGNQQLRMNHLRWGLDNWVYCANGGHHANHGLGIQIKSHRNELSYELGSRDFRFRPDTGELELESGPSQYGRNRDAWGHWFGTQNANPLWHYVLSDRYLARNPHVPTASPIKHLVGPGSPMVFPASSLEKRFHSFEQSGRFTSACSSMIYGDELLFGQGSLSHAFTCEPFHNLVQHNVLADAGISFNAYRPLGEGQLDFFASEDRWCRPVMARTGPDGGLWIADMYRYMIEHPEWLPPEGKTELLPHYRLGDDRGRIYRVVPVGANCSREVSLADADIAEIVAAIDSPNDWQRDKAHQMLIWMNDQAAVPLLEKLAQSSIYPQARVQSLYALDGLHALSIASILAALTDVNPRIRENALRLAEHHESREIVASAAQLTHDPDAKVCLQLALTLGQWSSPRAGQALVELAARYGDEPFMVAAILSSALKHSNEFTQELVNTDPQVLANFRVPLLRQSIAAGNSAAIALLIKSVLTSEDQVRMQSLDELLLSLQRVGADLHQLADADKQNILNPLVSQVDSILVAAKQIALDTSRTDTERISAAIVLCRPANYRETGVELLIQWLRPQVDPSLQARVIEAIAQSGIDKVPAVLADAWPKLTPELRGRAIDAWLSRESWTNDLLDLVAAQHIPARSLDLSQRSRLLQHPKKSISQKAKAVLEVVEQSNRKQVVEQYRRAFELPGQASKGQIVHARACASCHRRGEEGHDVGPNLATVVEHTDDKLLTNILDPSADIQPGYHAYTCLLDSGEILAGILASETANSLTIKQSNGLLRTIARSEVELLQSSNMSFMPEGLETLLSYQDMADLLAYLHQPLRVEK